MIVQIGGQRTALQVQSSGVAKATKLIRDFEDATDASIAEVEANRVATQAIFDVAGEVQSGASVTMLASGTGAVARSVQDKLRDTVSIKDFGAATTGDTTAAINNALASGARFVRVPPGTYRVDGTILLPTFVTLQIDGTLSRLSAHSASTRPVILINDVQLAKVCGRGSIITENASPDGIICIGPEDPTVAGNQTIETNWNTVECVSLTGAGLGTDNIGVKIECTAAYTGGDKVCYQNWVERLEIHSVDHGILAGSQVNANFFNSLHMWNIGANAVWFAGNRGLPATYPAASITDNTVNGIFVHSSYTLQNTIKCESASFNTFSALNGEPGSGRLFSFDANSESNVLVGVENHPQAGVNLGSNNTILTNANISTVAPKFFVCSSATQAAATGDGTNVNVALATELYDTWPGGAFASSQFVAPLAGKYRLSGVVYLNGIGAAHTGIDIRVATSNRTYLVYSVAVSTQNMTTAVLPWSVLADMDAGDFAVVQAQVSGGAKTVNIYGDGSTATHFCGELAA